MNDYIILVKKPTAHASKWEMYCSEGHNDKKTQFYTKDEVEIAVAKMKSADAHILNVEQIRIYKMQPYSLTVGVEIME